MVHLANNMIDKDTLYLALRLSIRLFFKQPSTKHDTKKFVFRKRVEIFV
jgi:hypothetical protein